MKNKVDFDDYTDNYNELLSKNTQFFSNDEDYFAHYKVAIVAAQHQAKVRRVLEYGCGIGRNFPSLQAAFPNAEWVGTDISESSLDVARKENPDVQFIVEDGELDTLGKFDLIFVAGVFHHIPLAQRADAAKLLANRLSDNGALYVFEHNPYNPVTRHIVNTCPYDEDAIILKPKTLIGLLKQAEMEIEGQGYCLFVPPRFKRLVALEKYLSRVPLGGQYWVKSSHS